MNRKRTVQRLKASLSRIKSIVMRRKAAFDEKVHPKIKEFWETIRERREDDPRRVRKHPFYALYGEELSKSGYKQHVDHNISSNETIQILRRIIRIEAEHKNQLEELAVKIVCEIWDCPQELLEPHLHKPPPEHIAEHFSTDSEDEHKDFLDEFDEFFSDEETDEFEGTEEVELSENELRDEINKRITMNTLTHGAALHQMMSVHHLAREVLKQLDQELVDLYTQLVKATHKSYWQIFVGEGLDVVDAAIGTVKVEWKDDNKVKVHGHGLVFPVLVQELSKGVMEVLTAHGLSALPPKAQKKVVEEADRLDEEQWLIQVGPELWRRFLKIVPRAIPLSNIITELSLKQPNEVQQIIEAVIDNPEEAQELLSKL